MSNMVWGHPGLVEATIFLSAYKNFLNLQPHMPFLILPLSKVTIPDHCAHWLCRLVPAAVIQYFPMGKMLRD